MATQAQINANRSNAQSSTGPRTPADKGLSSRNAFKSGLDADSQFVYGEDSESFIILQTEYFDQFQPCSPMERYYVDNLIRNEWTLRRLFRAEAHLWEHHVIHASRSEGTPLAQALNTSTKVFTCLQRRITLTERSYKESTLELVRLQQSRPPAPPVVEQPSEPAPVPQATPQPQQTTSQTAQLGSFLNSAETVPGSVKSWPPAPTEFDTLIPTGTGPVRPPAAGKPATPQAIHS